jgi:3-oxoacyl-[acyl-carrier protein] reductase
MNLGLEGRRVLVTGASRGIGRAIALAFGREKARVAVTSHADLAGLQETRRQLGSAETIGLRLDLADGTSIASVASALLKRWGAVDVLVNNAVAWPGLAGADELFENAPVERFRDSLRANLEGPYLLTRALVGSMRDAGWGRVVHISTGLVEDGMPGASAYVAAKAGLHGLTRTMARELARVGILTNLVMPGFTLVEGRDVPRSVIDRVTMAAATGRTTTPQDVANVVVFLGSPANTHVNGEQLRVDGHFLAPS